LSFGSVIFDTKPPSWTQKQTASNLGRFTSLLSWFGLGASHGVSKTAWSATDPSPLDLHPQGVQVLGVDKGYLDTDMTAGVRSRKASPADVVNQVLPVRESGAMRCWQARSPETCERVCICRSASGMPGFLG
jgi:hypothetical protein